MNFPGLPVGAALSGHGGGVLTQCGTWRLCVASGSWDPSDSGDSAQIRLLDETLPVCLILFVFPSCRDLFLYLFSWRLAVNVSHRLQTTSTVFRGTQ